MARLKTFYFWHQATILNQLPCLYNINQVMFSAFSDCQNGNWDRPGICHNPDS